MTNMIEVLDWDSEFFGFKVGRLLPSRLDPEQLAELEEQRQDKEIKLLYWLADPQQPGLGEITNANGFRFMDFRLEFDLRLTSDAPPLGPSDNVRLYSSQDLEPLIRIAKVVHTDSRFAIDPKTHSKCGLLFEKWIMRDTSREKSAVFVADIGDGACGYCTCHPNPSNSSIGQIGLVGVNPNSIGKGLGQELLRASINWFIENGFESIQVVTQGVNIGAQRLYQRFGFKTCKTGVWFHRDYDDAAIQQH